MNVYYIDNNGQKQQIRFNYVPNTLGGYNYYAICPKCNSRRRILYLKNGCLICRDCAKLNYRSQQISKSGILFEKASKLLRDKLEYNGDFKPIHLLNNTIKLCKPKGMHIETYAEYLKEFDELSKQYQKQVMREIRAIINRSQNP